MNIIAHLAILGWLPFTVLLFGILPARTAVLVACIGGVLFLPMGGLLTMTGLPVYDKITLSAFGVLVVAAMFDAKRFMSFRPRLFDLVPVLLVIGALVSSLLIGNGLPSLQSLIDESMKWVAPYFLGRLYFSDLRGLRELAIGMAIGGLIYVPLCAYELRMSPVLHSTLYGFHQHSFAQSRREDGWRPVVFMQHGLMVGFWMAATAIVLFWLWRSKTIVSILGIPAGLASVVLIVIASMCKSLGATVLMIVGIATLLSTRTLKTKWLLIGLLALPIAYQVSRATHIWDGSHLVAASKAVSEGRASSLSTRLHAEGEYTRRALQRPLFGWGGWGHYRTDGRGGYLPTVDGLWLYVLGKYGLVGLTLFNLMVLVPVGRFIRNYPASTWSTAAVAPACVLAMVVLLYLFDNLFNAMVNQVYSLAVGGLAGLAPPAVQAVRNAVSPFTGPPPVEARPQSSQ